MPALMPSARTSTSGDVLEVAGDAEGHRPVVGEDGHPVRIGAAIGTYG